jgi:hypothetical protein
MAEGLMASPRILTVAHCRPSLACCVADALRLRCAALDETLRQRCGPDLILALLRDIERLTDELKVALDAQDLLDGIRRQST